MRYYVTQSSSSNGKDTKSIDRDVYIEIASIESTCTKDTYASKSIDTGDTSSTGGAYIKGIFVRVTCAKNTYTRSANALKHLEIHLQSF